MNVIAKISCYFEHSVVTLTLRKEYLNTVIYNIPVLLFGPRFFREGRPQLFYGRLLARPSIHRLGTEGG